ncbi:MAG: DUF3592 domain-containing protein [Aquabacterium sp.]
MIPEQPGSRGTAALVQQLLAALLAALAFWSGVALVAGVRDALVVRSAWTQVPVVIESTPDSAPWEVEVPERDLPRLGPIAKPEHQTPRQPEHVQVLVPALAYSWLDRFDAATLAVHPSEPARVVLVDLWADLSLALARAVWLLLLGVAAWWAWQRLDWGRDLTWDGHGWSAGFGDALGPGGRASGDSVLSETRAGQVGTLVAAGLLGALALWTLFGALTEGRQRPIEAGFSLLVTVSLALAAAYWAVQTRTRRLRFDATGVADGNFFGTRRVPYPAIQRWERVNVQAQAQARYDAQSPSKRKGSRPADIWTWMAHGAGGSLLFKLEESLQPQAGFAALRNRIQDQLRPLGAATVHDPGDGHDTGHATGDEDEGEEDAEGAAAAEWRRMERQFEQHSGKVDKGLRWGFLAVVAPFALMFLLPTWSALKYQFQTDPVQGTVVGRDGAEVVQLTITYTAADGRERRLVTDGTRGHVDITLGQKVPVLVRRDDPELAKLDSFWAVWIWPVIMGGLLLVVALPFGYGFIIAPRREAARRRRLLDGD